MVTVAINGAAGRMGQRLVALCAEDDQLQLAAAIERHGCDQLGQDAGCVAMVGTLGTVLAERLEVKVDVLIDFTTPSATRAVLKSCVDTGTAIVIGTTGLNEADHRDIEQAANKIPVLQSPNMSLGVNLMFALAGQVASRLGDDYDIELTEAHHRYKKDAPSGTALGIAEAICDATGKNMATDVVYDRHGQDVPRRRGEIGMHAVRMGDVVGEHTVQFATLGERLEITHTATTRDIFARGALVAAKWLAGQAPGRYRMQDVLGLQDKVV